MTTQLPDQAAYVSTGGPTAVEDASTATVEVKIATEAEREQLIATIVLAFNRDPVVRWCYPEPDQYLAHWPRFVNAFAGKAFEHGSAHHADGYTGVALWLPPGVSPDEEELISVLQHTVPERPTGLVRRA